MNQLEFDERFATERACRQYLEQLRWSEGFVCPRCQHPKAGREGRGRQMCARCLYPVSATAGTIFQGTRKPLRLWFRAAWYVPGQKHGASALGLPRVLGLGSYVTAWSWWPKRRRAMVRPGREALTGKVEGDETYVGALAEGKRGRGAGRQALGVIAAEADGKGRGRMRMARGADASAPSLQGCVQSAVARGSRVHPDGGDGYAGVGALGDAHEASVLPGQGQSAPTRRLPRGPRVAALLKRWLRGTHQGAVRPDHLDYSLDEFTFRFHRRTSRSRGKLFYRLIEQAVQVGTFPRQGNGRRQALAHPMNHKMLGVLSSIK